MIKKLIIGVVTIGSMALGCDRPAIVRNGLIESLDVESYKNMMIADQYDYNSKEYREFYRKGYNALVSLNKELEHLVKEHSEEIPNEELIDVFDYINTCKITQKTLEINFKFK